MFHKLVFRKPLTAPKKCIGKHICQIHQMRWIKYKSMVWNLIKYIYAVRIWSQPCPWVHTLTRTRTKEHYQHRLILTLNVPPGGLSYLGLTRSISRLLMPRLLTSPGHQQPWYWLVEYVSPGLTCGEILSTCVTSIWSNDTKCKWVRLRNCGCLVTWFCYQLIAKPGNKTATVSWPDPSICLCSF